MQVRIRQLPRAKGAQHSVVSGGLEMLEFVNLDLPMVDRNKIREQFKLLDVHVQLLDLVRVIFRFFLNGRF